MKVVDGKWKILGYTVQDQTMSQEHCMFRPKYETLTRLTNVVGLKLKCTFLYYELQIRITHYTILAMFIC